MDPLGLGGSRNALQRFSNVLAWLADLRKAADLLDYWFIIVDTPQDQREGSPTKGRVWGRHPPGPLPVFSNLETLPATRLREFCGGLITKA